MVQEKLDSAIAKPKSQQDSVEEPVIEDKPAPDPIKESKKQNTMWHSITDEVSMNFRGERRTFNEIVIYIRKTCDIPEYSDIIQVRDKEEKIGNLIADIYIQKAKAQFAFSKLESQRISRLGQFVASKDRRSMSAIEARLSAQDKPYIAINELQSDCKSTLDFWHDMYNICLRSTDRLKQISMALMAEMKLEPSDQGGKGARVKGY